MEGSLRKAIFHLQYVSVCLRVRACVCVCVLLLKALQAFLGLILDFVSVEKM